MNRLSIVCMAALLVMAMSCKKEKDGNEVQGSGFRASLETPTGDSKTHLEGTAVKWNDGDAILVVNGSSVAKEFTLQGTAPSEGYADFQSEDATDSFYQPVYKAYYPANLYDAETGRVTLPETQTYVANSFGPGFNPMAAQAEGTTLDFRNICGMLELQLTGSCTVSSIRITAKGSEKLWGTGELILTGNGHSMTPTLGTLTGGTGTITLNCNNQVTLTSEATKFYFVLPHNSLNNGFDVLLTDSEGNVWERSASAGHNTTISRSNITTMAQLPVEPTNPITPSVTISSGCIACTYTIGGTVTVPIGSHACEFGFVYSETNHQPTLNDSKIIVHSLSDSPIYGTEPFEADVFELTEGKEYYFRAYALIDGIAYSATTETVSTPYPNTWPDGKSPYPFTVGPGSDPSTTSDDVKVYFSKGNLQYNPIGATATVASGGNVGGTWRFAEHQFDMAHTSDDSDVSDEYKSTYNGWIDLFGWGTSGVNHNNACYQPWSTGGTDFDYCAYSNSNYLYHLYDQTGEADWGIANTISNGGTYEWRTPKGRTLDNAPWEWKYLISERPNASILHGEGKINCVEGLIILPDNWTWTGNVAEFASRWVPGESAWVNTYTFSEWAKMEAEGAVFLPAAGARNNVLYGQESIIGVGVGGGYQSSSSANANEEDYFNFQSSFIRPEAGFNKRFGYSVRLVSDVSSAK